MKHRVANIKKGLWYTKATVFLYWYYFLVCLFFNAEVENRQILNLPPCHGTFGAPRHRNYNSHLLYNRNINANHTCNRHIHKRFLCVSHKKFNDIFFIWLVGYRIWINSGYIISEDICRKYLNKTLKRSNFREFFRPSALNTG